MKLVGLSGKAHSGKSTLADELAAKFNWHHKTLAGPLKMLTRQIFDLTKEQTDGPLKDEIDTRYGCKPRQILIEFGRYCREKDPNFWILKLTKDLLSIPQAQLATVVVGDVRFVNEAQWIKRHGGLMIRLNRDVDLRGEDINDTSETSLDDYPDFDLVVPESWNVDMADIKTLAVKVHELTLAHAIH